MGDGFTIDEIGSVGLMFAVGSMIPFAISPLLVGSDRGFPKHLPMFVIHFSSSTHSRLSIKRHTLISSEEILSDSFFSQLEFFYIFLWARKLSL